MTKLQKIDYILNYQGDIDKELVPDFDIHTKDELTEMTWSEVSEKYQDVINAEKIMDFDYQKDYIKHGRSGC